jgi:GNAT superfamily N-acetyltransferase
VRLALLCFASGQPTYARARSERERGLDHEAACWTGRLVVGLIKDRSSGYGATPGPLLLFTPAWETVAVTVTVRAARIDDVPALVRLRLANAERHVGLDPDGHRVPDTDAVRRHFENLLGGSDESPVLVLVAEVAGTVVGMSEVVISADAPPDHQILVPRRTAEVHTVVLEHYRGKGVGTALVRAAEQHAARNGVTHLIAPILSGNGEGIGFYSRAGFGPHGILLSKEITGAS